MARSTCDNTLKAPKGMLKFRVIRSTIKDSLGQYCVPDDMAILTKDAAQTYLDANWIKVALPDFDDDIADPDQADEDADTDDTSTEGAGDSGKAETDPSPRPVKRARRN